MIHCHGVGHHNCSINSSSYYRRPVGCYRCLRGPSDFRLCISNVVQSDWHTFDGMILCISVKLHFCTNYVTCHASMMYECTCACLCRWLETLHVTEHCHPVVGWGTYTLRRKFLFIEVFEWQTQTWTASSKQICQCPSVSVYLTPLFSVSGIWNESSWLLGPSGQQCLWLTPQQFRQKLAV